MQDYLKVECYTWERENYDLYDYDSQDITKNQLEINKTGVLERQRCKVIFKDVFSRKNSTNKNEKC